MKNIARVSCFVLNSHSPLDKTNALSYQCKYCHSSIWYEKSNNRWIKNDRKGRIHIDYNKAFGNGKDGDLTLTPAEFNSLPSGTVIAASSVTITGDKRVVTASKRPGTKIRI